MTDTETKRRARVAVANQIRRGERPTANSLPCVDCGHVYKHGALRHEYDHHNGYGPGHETEVEVVCRTCHDDRGKARKEHRGRAPVGPLGAQVGFRPTLEESARIDALRAKNVGHVSRSAIVVAAFRMGLDALDASPPALPPACGRTTLRGRGMIRLEPDDIAQIERLATKWSGSFPAVCLALIREQLKIESP